MRRFGKTLFMLLILLFLYLPILLLAVYSFTDASTIGAFQGFSLHNYRTLFTSQELLEMIWGTVLLALISSLLATVLGTMGAIGAYYSRKKMRVFIHSANEIPVVNADVVTGFSICILLVVVLGMDKNTFLPLLFGHTTLSAPFVYLAVLPKLKQMDNNIYEAALDLGATPSQALTKVLIPQILPGILSGFTLAVTLSLDDYFIATYTKPATFDTISTYVVNATKGSQTDIKTALWALSTVIFFVVILAVILMNVPKARAAAFSFVLAGLLAGMVFGMASAEQVAAKSREKDTVVLRVHNWEEYMDLGEWDEPIVLADGTEIMAEQAMIKDFEEWYFETYGQKVKVEYSCFGTNEDLYNQLTLGDKYDLVCPSDYMIMKLMAEGKLEPFSDEFFDMSNPYNYYTRGVSPFIRKTFAENMINGESWSQYAAGYMMGTTGWLYNPEKVDKEDVATWDAAVNQKYKRQITVKDNVRDTYFAVLGMIKAKKITSKTFLNSFEYSKRLAKEMNDVSTPTIKKALELLQETRENAYSFETDSGKSDMVTGKVVISYQWSGDAVYAMDLAEEDGIYLSFSVPKECTNLFFDGWIMLKNGLAEDARKKQAAEAFVNFISRPDNAVRNMSYIGYTSVIAGEEGDTTVVDYIRANYETEDTEDAVEYPIGYFFTGDNEDEEYIIHADASQLDRQLFAQYPPEDVIQRSAIMGYYTDDKNAELNRMWIDMRCFNLSQVPSGAWYALLFILILLVLFVIYRKENEANRFLS